MHGEAPPHFDGEEVRLAIRTTQKIEAIETYDILGHPGQSVAVWDIPGSPGHTLFS